VPLETSEEAAALLLGLTSAQRAAVTSDAGTLCVVAGAGSGKTTVLTRRIAWRVRTGAMEAEHALVCTFTRKAAAELRERLARLGVEGVWAGTFHAAAYAQLRQHWADSGKRAPSVVGDGRRLLGEVVARTPGAGEGVVGAVMAEAAWARARLIEPSEYPPAAQAAGRTPGLPAEQVAGLLEEYRREKAARGVLDVDDLVGECAQLLRRSGAAAAVVRWRFRHLFVDEFQDVNPAQWDLLGQWRHDRDDLCVVGDPRQAVYGWNGSDPSLLDRLPALLPGVVTLSLDENRRSSPQVVAAASAVLSSADAPDGVPGGAPAATAADGPAPLVTGFDDEAAEAAAVARWLRRSRRPEQPWHRLAVLARTNARLEMVADALRSSGIPVRRAGRAAPRRDGTGAIVLLRAIDPGTRLQAALVDVRAELDEAGDWLPSVADAYLADGCADDLRGPTVGGFLAWLAASPDAAELDHRADGVELATFHRAKGLEWRAVALVGLEDGTVPIVHATTAEARAEERRLFYVALTRAESELWCSWAARTGEPGRGRDRRPSPYLTAVRSSASRAEPTSPVVAVGRIAGLRDLLPAAPDPESERGLQSMSTKTGA